MGDAWGCHYRKNLPGWPNPWDLCIDEIQSFLVCSDPLTGHNLTLAMSGYSKGLPDEYKSAWILYGGTKGIFEVQMWTGTLLYDTPCSEGSGWLTLYMTNSVGSGSSGLLLDTGFQLDAQGYYSGEFDIPWITGLATLSGVLFGRSGTYTGLYSIPTDIPASVVYIYPFEAPSIANAIFNNVNEFSGDLFNANYYYSGTILIYASNDYESNYVLVGEYPIGPNGYQMYMEDIGMDFMYYYVGFIPTGNTEGIMAEAPISGGHPPPATGMKLRWYYNSWDEPITRIPVIEIAINPALTGIYQGGTASDFQLEYSGEAVSNWTYFTNTAYDFVSGRYLFDISSLSAAGTYWFRTSGQRYEGGGTYWSPIYSDGPFDLDGITAYAETSTAECAINVRWDSPPYAEGFVISWSGIGYPEDVNETGVPLGDVYTYTIDTSEHCTRWYGITVCRSGTSVCSEMVSGKGQMRLKKADYEAYIYNVEPADARPTISFNVQLNWEISVLTGTYDERAEEMSGYRQCLVDNSRSAHLRFFEYHDNYPDGDPWAFDAGNFPYNQNRPNGMIYSMMLASGLDTSDAVSGAMEIVAIEAGPAPEAPNITGGGVVNPAVDPVDIFLGWEGKAEQYGYWRYVIHRSTDGLETYTGYAPEKGTGTSFTDTSLERDHLYSYKLETQSWSQDRPDFTGLSDWSNSLNVQVDPL